MKIRIAVAVDPSGAWCAHGAAGLGGQEAMDVALDSVHPGEAQYWVEVDVDIPRPKEIHGSAIHRDPRLTDEAIDSIAEKMPDGVSGFLKGWGWRQFARAIEDAHGVGPNAELRGDPPALSAERPSSNDVL